MIISTPLLCRSCTGYATKLVTIRHAGFDEFTQFYYLCNTCTQACIDSVDKGDSVSIEDLVIKEKAPIMSFQKFSMR